MRPAQICTRCRQLKPWAEFVGSKGRQRQSCTPCAKKNLLSKRAGGASGKLRGRVCSKCRVWKPFKTGFYRSVSARMRGYQSRCKDCTNATSHSGRSLRDVQSRAEFSLPEREGSQVCQKCRSAIRYGTNLNGVAVMWCHCDEGLTRLVPVIRPPSFERYSATQERIEYLAKMVGSACEPIERDGEWPENGIKWTAGTYRSEVA